MKQFTSVTDIADVQALIREALALKANPLAHQHLGKNKTLGLIFLNPSLRTRMSTQIAAQQLGMNVITLNADKDGWALEFQDGAVMNGSTVEHIRDAAPVLGSYCDVIGVRCFPGLQSRETDDSEHIMRAFMRHTGKPYVSLESATLHPLQSLADAITLTEHRPKHRPKVVLSWAPHIKPIPHAVANSFAEWMNRLDVELVITHPEGYALSPKFTGHARIEQQQQKALEGADFVYVKNWSSYADYGKILTADASWMLTQQHLKETNQARVMHCLPVRRNVELSDEILDSSASLVQEQARNRIFAAQAVLKQLLENN
ncbi:MAG TPA: N-acetylornithine carbamoyltransferase [Saprospiraceae bacterium]|nr:N-acetylornithine carbamoyltransferase [Saprospiraceae bacterium]